MELLLTWRASCRCKGKRHGHGVLTFQNTDVYDGEFCNNAQHGQGRMQYKVGCLFPGSFRPTPLGDTTPWHQGHA